MSEENDKTEQEQNSKNMSDRSHEVGRDGAYLEVDVKDLVSAYHNGDLEKAAILVIKSSRIEISEPQAVASVVDKVKEMMVSHEVSGMSNEQIGFYIMLNALIAGLKK